MGHHRSSEAGIFDFVDNVKNYRESGDQIAKKMTAIRKRIDGDHAVGNGNFVKLEDLRSRQSHALSQILKGVVVIAVGIGAVVGAGLSKGCDSENTENSLPFNGEGLK